MHTILLYDWCARARIYKRNRPQNGASNYTLARSEGSASKKKRAAPGVRRKIKFREGRRRDLAACMLRGNERKKKGGRNTVAHRVSAPRNCQLTFLPGGAEKTRCRAVATQETRYISLRLRASAVRIYWQSRARVFTPSA